MSDQMKSFPVLDILEHHPGLKSFYFKKISKSIIPGQFVNIWIPDIDEKPFSVSDVSGRMMEITIKDVGPFSHAMMQLSPGDRCGIRGPFGNGFKTAQHTLLVGGGMGIVPLRYLARKLRKRGRHFEVLLGAKTAADIPFADVFETWAPTRFVTDDGSKGEKGLVTDYIEAACNKSSLTSICASGPEPMLVRLMDVADRHKLDYQISFERYMKCGIGICGQCSVDGSGIRICKEGPVLNREMASQVTEWGMPHRDAGGLREI